MRYTTTDHRRRSPVTTTLARLVLVAAALAAPATGEPAEERFCPPSFQCSPRMKVLLAHGVERSESFRALVETLGSHSGVNLDMSFRRPRAGKRAQSDLKVTGHYAVENNEKTRQVTGVSGVVTVPYASYGHKQIALIAHELAHVLIRLRGGPPIDRQVEEREANEIEDMVSADLKSANPAKNAG
jgi:hypothetical protein